MNAKPARQLIAALRSGDFRQGLHRALDQDGRRCCLGVAAAISPPECAADRAGIETTTRNVNAAPLTGEFGKGEAVIPNEPGRVRYWLGISRTEEAMLVALNDLNNSFMQIASYIEDNFINDEEEE